MKVHAARNAHAAKFAKGIFEFTRIPFFISMQAVKMKSNVVSVCTQLVVEKQQPGE